MWVIKLPLIYLIKYQIYLIKYHLYTDKVRMYEEIMTNDDNLESSLPTSNL